MGSTLDIPDLEVLLGRVSQQCNPNACTDILSNKIARGKLLASLQQLTKALEQPEDIVQRVMCLPSTYMCARVAIDLKLFNTIAEAPGQVSSGQLAVKTGAEEQLLVRLLRGLTIAGLVDEVSEGTYQANVVTQNLTIPSVQAGLIHFYDAGLRSVWSMPKYLNQNGYKLPTDSVSGPFQYAFDTPMDTYAFWQTQPAFADNFNVFMAGKLSGSKTGQSWEDIYPVQQNIIDAFDPQISDAIFVDIAGGRGHEVGQLKGNFPNAPGRFVLEDLPAVIAGVKELDPAIERIACDFFEPQVVKGARAYFMANIMHNWTDADCVRILKNVVKEMVKGYSRLLISDHILPATGCELASFGRDIGMLSMHGGCERSERQWKALLEPLGLRIERFYHLGRGEGLIDAVVGE